MLRNPGNPLIVVALALAVAFLIGNGAVAYRSTRVLADYGEQVTHTQEVLAQLQGVLVALDDAETGQRGYLLLGDEAYLAPYTAALDQLPARLDRVQQPPPTIRPKCFHSDYAASGISRPSAAAPAAQANGLPMCRSTAAGSACKARECRRPS